MHLLLVLSMIQCQSPFSTRKPESPTTQDAAWVPARSADEVIENLKTAISERHLEHYLRNFVDETYSEHAFVFVPDQDVQSNYPEVFTNWNLQQEQNVMRQAFSLIPDDSISYLQFPDTLKEDVGPDSMVTVMEYILKLPHTKTTLPVKFTGQLEFRMAEDQRGEWNIYHWEDFRVSETEDTWSVLKASLEGS